ncbi:MAG TPA: hypothetical protein VKO85_09500 [Wenzhouxiangellaceae bacterium]|nr:hypothetical protein [Wenzhouxiangellaceae bacterium]
MPVDYLLFPDDGHGFCKTVNRMIATVSILDWCAEHLDFPQTNANNGRKATTTTAAQSARIGR